MTIIVREANFVPESIAEKSKKSENPDFGGSPENQDLGKSEGKILKIADLKTKLKKFLMGVFESGKWPEMAGYKL